MKLVGNNIETLSIDMIVTLLKLLVVESFQDFYNFFIAWARTQRTSAIILLLESFPLRDLYKYRQLGTPSDLTCFDMFFRITEELRINDAIFYARCRHILTGEGNMENHFAVLDDLASTGQLLYMVGRFILKNLYKKLDTSATTLEDYTAIQSHPYYRMNIASALTQIQKIKQSVVVSHTGPQIYFVALCLIHSTVNEVPPIMHGITKECVFCNITTLLNRFMKNVT